MLMLRWGQGYVLPGRSTVDRERTDELRVQAILYPTCERQVIAVPVGSRS